MRIVELREARGWNQAELAHNADMRIATLSELENGKSNPRLSTLVRIADALGVNVWDLFADDSSDPDIDEVKRLFRLMAPDERKAFLTLLRRAEHP